MSQRESGRRLPRLAGITIAIGIVGVAASVFLYEMTRNRELRLFETEFRRHASEQIHHVEHELGNSLTLLEALHAFMDNSRPADRTKFRNFAEPLLARHESIQALEWLVVTLDKERVTHERLTREEGHPGYQITEQAEGGGIQPAGSRSEYFVVHFVEPIEGNRPALGYDVGSEPVRLDALVRSRDTGQPAATGPIGLVQASAERVGVLLVQAVYRTGVSTDTVSDRRAALEGFVLLTLDIDKFVEIALGPLVWNGIELTITDQTSGNQGVLHAAGRGGGEIVESATIAVAGRRWVIACRPESASVAGTVTAVPLAILICGLLATFLLVIYMIRLMGLDRHVQADLNKVKDQLVRHTRLAAIGQVAASVAHDLRNPLGGIRNATFYLRRKEHLREIDVWKRYLDLIDEETQRAEKIIRALLDNSQAQIPSKRPVNLGELVDSAFAASVDDDQVRCECDFDPQRVVLHADETLMSRLFVNLFSNAVQAMDGSGVIRVGWERADGFDEITIRDHGPGVPPDISDRIFEPLYTTKAKGTGLGLAICRQIAEGHGGTISTLDADGTGGVFHVRLPSRS